MSDMKLLAAERLGSFVSSRDPVTDGKALDRAKHAITDGFACVLGGLQDPSVSAVRSALAHHEAGNAFICGVPSKRGSASVAAFINATAAHALDYDDNFDPFCGHPTAILLPALLALADEREMTGGDLIQSYLVGLDTLAWLGRNTNPHHYQRGWHATSTLGAVGTAAACGHLLRLPADRISAAISIACSMAGGTRQQYGSMMKPVHAGLAARAGVTAALLAESGLEGDPGALDGPWGLLQVAVGKGGSGAAACDLPFDTSPSILRYGLLAKLYPCCGAAHRSLTGLEHLQQAESAISAIHFTLPKIFRDNLRFDRPESVSQARFSLTYCAARLWRDRTLSLRDMTAARVSDGTLGPFFDKITIEVVADPPGGVDGLAGMPIPTRATYRDGSERTVATSHAKGSPYDPLDERELEKKFADCCAFASIMSAERLFAHVERFPASTNVRRFTSGLADLLLPSVISTDH